MRLAWAVARFALDASQSVIGGYRRASRFFVACDVTPDAVEVVFLVLRCKRFVGACVVGLVPNLASFLMALCADGDADVTALTFRNGRWFAVGKSLLVVFVHAPIVGSHPLEDRRVAAQAVPKLDELVSKIASLGRRLWGGCKSTSAGQQVKKFGLLCSELIVGKRVLSFPGLDSTCEVVDALADRCGFVLLLDSGPVLEDKVSTAYEEVDDSHRLQVVGRVDNKRRPNELGNGGGIVGLVSVHWFANNEYRETWNGIR